MALESRGASVYMSCRMRILLLPPSGEKREFLSSCGLLTSGSRVPRVTIAKPEDVAAGRDQSGDNSELGYCCSECLV